MSAPAWAVLVGEDPRNHIQILRTVVGGTLGAPVPVLSSLLCPRPTLWAGSAPLAAAEGARCEPTGLLPGPFPGETQLHRASVRAAHVCSSLSPSLSTSPCPSPFPSQFPSPHPSLSLSFSPSPGHCCEPQPPLVCRIHIHELQMNDSTVDFAEDVGVQLTVDHARIQLSATWRAQLGAW